MLSLQEIKRFYPQSLQRFERFLFREYLQYKILEIIFETPYASKLSFLGGTCLRIVHNNKRFSEDLDFDSFQLTSDDFTAITDIVERELLRIGYDVEMRNVQKGAYHCYIRFPGLLYASGLSDQKEEKILIQLDTESHDFDYKPDQPVLNRFDVFTQINVTPVDILLAQKFYAVINRKRNKGRDFYDIVFLLGQRFVPNYDYLKAKAGITNHKDLKSHVLQKCRNLNMEEMAAGVRPFLFDPQDDKRIILFTKYLEQCELSR